MYYYEKLFISPVDTITTNRDNVRMKSRRCLDVQRSVLVFERSYACSRDLETRVVAYGSGSVPTASNSQLS